MYRKCWCPRGRHIVNAGTTTATFYCVIPNNPKRKYGAGCGRGDLCEDNLICVKDPWQRLESERGTCKCYENGTTPYFNKDTKQGCRDTDYVGFEEACDESKKYAIRCLQNSNLVCSPPRGGGKCICTGNLPNWNAGTKQCQQNPTSYGSACGGNTGVGCTLPGLQCVGNKCICNPPLDFWEVDPGDVDSGKCVATIGGACTNNAECARGLTCVRRKCACGGNTPHWHNVDMKCYKNKYDHDKSCSGVETEVCWEGYMCNPDGKCDCMNTFWHDRLKECLPDSYSNFDQCNTQAPPAPTRHIPCYLGLVCVNDHCECENKGFWHNVKERCYPERYSFNDPCTSDPGCYYGLVCSPSGKCVCENSNEVYNELDGCIRRVINRRGGAEKLKVVVGPLKLGILLTFFNMFGTLISTGFHK